MDIIKFNASVYLIIGVMMVAAAWIFRRRDEHEVRQMSRETVLRIMFIIILFVGLADPQLLMKVRDQCAIFAVDVSSSIQKKERQPVKDYIFSKIDEKEDDDRIGVLQFGENADILVPPTDFSHDATLSTLSELFQADQVNPEFTDIEGAVLKAAKLFPEGCQKRIVLISDGNENAGRVSDAYRELASGNIGVDVLPVGGMDHAEVLVESLYAPPAVKEGTPFNLDIATRSNVATKATLKITVDRQKRSFTERMVTITPGGRQIHRIPVTLEEGGIHQIDAALFSEEDSFYVNNSATTSSRVESRPRVLFVTGQSRSGSGKRHEYLAGILSENRMDVEIIPSYVLPPNIEKYGGYDALILDDIDFVSLRNEQMEAVAAAVHDLGTGLILVSGRNSMGGRGGAGTPIESALPVRLLPSPGKRPSTMDLILVIDKSGSMSEGAEDTKIQIAIDAMQSIIKMFSEEDRAGIIAFDSEAHIIAYPGLMKNREEIIRKIQGITPRGSTDFYPALMQAHSWLRDSEAQYRHIILLSDGMTRERDFTEFLGMIRKENITLSTVGIGKNGNSLLMKKIARGGSGRFYQVEDDFYELKNIFRTDSLLASGSLTVEETFTPVFRDPDPILRGVSFMMPVMHGYAVTSPRTTAVIPIISQRGDPIIGFWRYGLGKAAIFTGDDGSSWSKDWLSWEGFGRLWVQLVARTMRSRLDGKTFPLFLVRGSTVEIRYELTERQKKNVETFIARILYPDGKTHDVILFQTLDGSYKGDMHGLAPGRYQAVIAADRSGDTQVLAMGNFSISGAQEFLTLDVNNVLFENIVAETGGRILSQQDPLFEDRREEGRRYIAISPYLFVLAAALFLMNVAIYRGIHPLRRKERSSRR